MGLQNSNQSHEVNNNYIGPQQIQANSNKKEGLAVSARLRFKKEVSKINNDNIIYYVVGVTLILVLVIYFIPVIFGYFNKRHIEKAKIVTDQSTEIFIKDLSSNSSVIPVKTDTKSIKKTIKLGNKDEIIGVFKTLLIENKSENLVSYIEPGAKLYLWNGGCCKDRDVTPEYIASLIKISSSSNINWNFDQDQIDIKKIRDIDDMFKDTYAGVSSKGTLLAVKFSESNKISEVNIVVSVQDAYEATKPQDPNIIYNAQNSQ